MSQLQSSRAAQQFYADDTAERVEQFIPLVRKLAWQLSGSAGPSLDVEDLMQAGLVALTQCVRRHQGPGQDGFAAYAKLRIRGAMIDLLRASCADGRSSRVKRRRLDDAGKRLHLTLGREPTHAELAAELDIAIDELHRLRADAAPIALSSIEECYSDHDGAFAATRPDAEAILLQHEDRAALTAAISALPERLQMVIQLYFVDELNLAEIAAVLGVSVPRVHQLKASALATLHKALTEG